MKKEMLSNCLCCHPELDSGSCCYKKQGEIPYQVRNDCFFHNSGFTLIELLVVVLIIGILASVALPQYKVAVGKARMTQLVTLSNAVRQAQERYYLANGRYTNQWDELDLNMQGIVNPLGDEVKQSSMELVLYLKSNARPESLYATDTRLPGILLITMYAHSEWWGGRQACYATEGNALSHVLCKHVTQTTTPKEDGMKYWQ